MSISIGITETHELGLEEFDARVSVDLDGSVWISFHESGKCVLTMNPEDLGKVVSFAEMHGQITVIER
jgi:hypothetical protein